jgi:mono/diheme cytochrome c family protein
MKQRSPIEEEPMRHERTRCGAGVFGLIVLAISLAACGQKQDLTPTLTPPEPTVEVARTAEAEQDETGGEEHEVEAPEEYEGLVNPFAGDPDAIEAGEQIYRTNCESCHGPGGEGDGPAAAALDPRPANLADTEMMQDMTDSFLFWRVSEGGAMEPFNSAMPAWKEVLSEEQRWQVIGYLRSLSQD